MARLFSFAAFVWLLGAAFGGVILPPDQTVKAFLQKDLQPFEADEERLFSSKEFRSTKRAFFYSLILPGAGELYAGSYVKSAAFFACEAAFWSGFFFYLHRYNVKVDEFRDYADEHWYEDVWRQWYDSLCALKDTTELGIEILPDEHNQQYYEMIGKYDWFTFGWDDVVERDDYDSLVQASYEMAGLYPADQVHEVLVRDILSKIPSPHREHYMEMRNDANEQYTIAKYFVGAAIVNHLLSAFDAAWTVKRRNDRLYKGFSGIQSIRLRPFVAMRGGRPTPSFALTATW